MFYAAFIVLGLFLLCVGVSVIANRRAERRRNLGRILDPYCECGYDPWGGLCPLCGRVRDELGVWRKPELARVTEVRRLSQDEIQAVMEEARREGVAFDERTKSMEQLSPEDLRVKID